MISKGFQRLGKLFEYWRKWHLAMLKNRHGKTEDEVIRQLFGADFISFQNEILDDTSFITEINRRLALEHIRLFGGSQDWHYLLYALIRSQKPDVVVETGVSHGLSSATILKALDVNHKGVLYSIDLPDMVEDNSFLIPKGKKTGWVIPEHLLERFTLISGDAKEKLPLVMKDVKLFDVFLHDSCHEKKHTAFELATAYRHMRQGGLVLCHDAFDTSAFNEFCKAKNLKYINYYNFGIVSMPKGESKR